MTQHHPGNRTAQRDDLPPSRPGPGQPWRQRGAVRSSLPAGLLACLLGSVNDEARAEVYLNELVVRGTERAELYNSGPGSVLLDGWVLRGDLGDFVIPDETVIGAGAYLVFADLGGILHDIGGQGALIDDLKLSRDAVDYGQVGSAPLPHDDPGVSLCRTPDAAAGPPLDPADDARFWSLDLTATFGGPNDVPNPALGSSAVFNELGTTVPSIRMGSDAFEIYNPTGAIIILADWYASFGAGSTYFLTNSFVAPGGVVVETLPPELELDTTQLAYLFTDLHARVDQLGWSGSFLAGAGAGGAGDPASVASAGEGGELCIARCPDGAGPNDGYDGATSGGGETLVFTTCSLGDRNVGACMPSPVLPMSWGVIKGRYR